MASFLKEGENWRAYVCRKRVRRTKTFRAKAEARAWASKTEAEIDAGAAGEVIPASVLGALRKYAAEVSPTKKGARWEKVRLKKFEESLGFAGKQLADVRAADIAEWRDKGLAAGLAPASVRREMVLLRSVFELCRKEWGFLRENPMADVAKPPPGAARDRIWSQPEVEKVILALGFERGEVAETGKQTAAVAFLWALETGMRAGELLSLVPADVNRKARVAKLRAVKNDKGGHARGREVPLTKGADALLDCLPEGERVFPLSSASLDVHFREGRDKAGIDDATFHDARATFCTRMAKKVDVLTLARIIGHRDLKSLQVYYREAATDIAPRLD